MTYLCNESFVAFGEVDFGFEVHEVLAAGHCLCLCEVRTVRDAVNLVLRVLRELHDSHRRFHFHVRCFQVVVNLVHVLFKPATHRQKKTIYEKQRFESGYFETGPSTEFSPKFTWFSRKCLIECLLFFEKTIH